MLVAGYDHIILSTSFFRLGGTGAPYGLAFYDRAKAFISGIVGPVAMETALAVPVNAVYARIGWADSGTTLATAMVCGGSTLPDSFVPFKYIPPETVNLTREANAVQSVLLASQPKIINLFDYTRRYAATPSLILTSDGTVIDATSIGSSYYSSDYIPVIPGQQFTMAVGISASNPAYGLAYYDGSKAFVSAVGLPFTAGQVFTVPANVAWMRFSGISNPTSYTAQMITPGTSVPSNYVPFVQQATSSTVSQAAVSPLKNKVLGVWGDSISGIFGNAWQNVVAARTGCILGFQDARSGRSFVQNYVFECYGGSPTGTNQGTVSTPTGNYANNGTVGNTLAQDLAFVDLMIVWLGTNDFGITLGAHGDAATAGTTYGNIRATIEALLTAKPGMRLVMITNQFRSDSTLAIAQGVALAIRTVAADYGVPVLDLTQTSGCNPITAATLLRDGIHPSATAFTTKIGPAIAQFAEQWV